MSDPIIPGIDDARAREIAKLMRGREWLEFHELFRGEPTRLKESRMAYATGVPGLLGITDAGRALWEELKNE